MDDLISRQAVEEWLEKWEGYIDQDTIARMQYRVIDIPSAQPDFYDYSDIEPLWESFAKEHDVNLTDGAKQLKDAMWVGYRKGKQDAQPGMEQIRWERDVAIQQLKDLGYGLGEKPRTDGDLISRAAAIDALCKAGCGSKYCGVSCDDVSAIEQLPSAQAEDKCGECDAWNQYKNYPRQHWIPCSDRLPIARQSVILSTKEWTGEGCYWETTEHHVIWKGYRWNATYWDDEVIAWMPLPEPWKGEEHEDK